MFLLENPIATHDQLVVIQWRGIKQEQRDKEQEMGRKEVERMDVPWASPFNLFHACFLNEVPTFPLCSTHSSPSLAPSLHSPFALAFQAVVRTATPCAMCTPSLHEVKGLPAIPLHYLQRSLCNCWSVNENAHDRPLRKKICDSPRGRTTQREVWQMRWRQWISRTKPSDKHP